MRSSLVCPVAGKNTLSGLLTLTWRPATSTIIFSSAMAPPQGHWARLLVRISARSKLTGSSSWA